MSNKLHLWEFHCIPIPSPHTHTQTTHHSHIHAPSITCTGLRHRHCRPKGNEMAHKHSLQFCASLRTLEREGSTRGTITRYFTPSSSHKPVSGSLVRNESSMPKGVSDVTTWQAMMKSMMLTVKRALILLDSVPTIGSESLDWVQQASPAHSCPYRSKLVMVPCQFALRNPSVHQTSGTRVTTE